MKIRDLLEDKQLYRPLSAIAKNIKADWKNPGYAKPYLDAMADLDKITDKYHADDAKSVVLYFLSNASTWKGPDAKEIKAELKAMLAGKPVAQSNRFYNVWFKKEVNEDLEPSDVQVKKKFSELSAEFDKKLKSIHDLDKKIEAKEKEWLEAYQKASTLSKFIVRKAAKLAGINISKDGKIVESLIVEGINFGVMQQKIYDFVLKKLKELNPGMHFSYAAELARTTDQFFTTSFDDCIKAFNTSDDMNEIVDELEVTVEEVSKVITDYFADAMNHPPGYAARKLKELNRDVHVTTKEIEDLIKKIDPNLEKELESRS
jgi:methyl-accepting chemotaxis protein